MAINTRTGKEIVRTFSDTISSGTTTAEIDLEGSTLVAIRTPASLASTSITFTVATSSGGTYVPLKDSSGNAISVSTSGTASQHALAPADFAGVRYVKAVCGSTETSKTITFVGRELV